MNSTRFYLASLILLWLLCPHSLAQECSLPNNQLGTQEDIDNLLIDFPDCEHVEGNITILEAEEGAITNLEALSNIKTISGSLIISNTSSLASLSGLAALEHIGDTLLIEDNEVLTDMSALTLLKSAGEILVSNNDLLQEMEAFSNLQYVEGSLRIRYHNELLRIPDFTALDSIGFQFEVLDNRVLAQIGDFPRLKKLGQLLKISYNDSLTVLPDFAMLESAFGLMIDENNALPSLMGFESLLHTDLLLIRRNDALTQVEGFDNLERIGQFLIFSGNDLLGAVSGFGQLESVDELLGFDQNPILNQLPAFESLRTVGGLNFQDNELLEELPLFTMVDSIAASFEIIRCPISSLDSNFENLEYIGGDLKLESTALTSLGTWSSLKHIAGDLAIAAHEHLQNLDALSELELVNGGLVLLQNAALECVEGLQALSGADLDRLIIQNNYILNQCNLTGLCPFLESIPELTIRGNASSCDDVDDWARLCGLIDEHECLLRGCDIHLEYSMDQMHADYPGCTSIYGDALFRDVFGNENTPDLITEIQGDVTISFSTTADLYGLNALNKIGGGLTIESTQLQNIDELSNLSEVGGLLRIAANPELQNLGGLGALEAIQQSLWISTNQSLEDLHGLQNIEYIHNNLVLENNNLSSLNGLHSLSEIGGYFNLIDENFILDIDALGQLSEIGHSLFIDDLQLLTDLDGLSHLEKLGKHLHIYNNSNLQSIEGLSHLNSIDGQIHLVGNDNLHSLHGLHNIDPQGIAGLLIKDCVELWSCSLPSLCNWLLLNSELAILENNDDGCSTVEEITEECEVETSRYSPPLPSKDHWLYPIPASRYLYFSLTLKGELLYHIYDFTGQCLKSGQISEHQIDIGELPAGGYLIQVIGENHYLSTKFEKN